MRFPPFTFPWILYIIPTHFFKGLKENMLEFEEYKAKLTGLKPTLDSLRQALNLEEAEREVAELEEESAQDGFWNDVRHSQQVQQRIKQLKGKCENYARLSRAVDGSIHPMQRWLWRRRTPPCCRS